LIVIQEQRDCWYFIKISIW